MAEDTKAVQRDSFGEVGMLEMPNARMAPDGALSFTLNRLNGSDRIELGFQVLPWLEGSFRYSRIAHFDSKDRYYDRSFGLKMRLFEEGTYTPDVSVGIRDLIGTGVYGAEYLVATKSIWDVDVSAGLGWGRLASNGTFRNPLGLLAPAFDRRAHFNSVGGQVNFAQFFRGPDMGVFGGATWHTPINNLNLTVEYSSDRYVLESRTNPFVKSPINVGLTYAPLNGVSLTAGWYYGDTIGGTLSFSVDPTQPTSPEKVGTPPMPVTPRTDLQQARAVIDLVRSSAGGSMAGVDMPDNGPQGRGRQARIDSAKAMKSLSDVEVDGHMLLVDVHASGHATEFCRVYEQTAALTLPAIHSVAVTDLDDPHGKVAFCEIADNDANAHAIPASALLSDAPDDEDADTAFGAVADAAKEKIRADAAAQSLRVEAISITPNKATVYYSNGRYNLEAEAVGRMVRVLMADAPSSVEIFRLVAVSFGRPSQDIQIFRAPLERMFLAGGSAMEIRSAVNLRPAPLNNPVLDAANDDSYPRFYWSLSPALREGLFDPASPLRIQVFAAASAGVTLLPGISLDAQFEANIYNNFANSTPSDSLLPHVRSDFAKYLTQGKNGISSLAMTYRGRIAPDLFVEARAGYLEDMFAGAGGQILWRPEGGRWALGADIYDVWQRNFDRLFGLRSYHVLTGHVSIYYQSPWHGLNLNLHTGRYLAGDNGLTLEVSRHFGTNVEVGAFATFTNVPFSKFGEGSFDKGIFINIPLEWALPFSTQSSYSLVLRPLTRDGGQRVDGDDSLYQETRRSSYDEITAHADNIANP